MRTRPRGVRQPAAAGTAAPCSRTKGAGPTRTSRSIAGTPALRSEYADFERVEDRLEPAGADAVIEVVAERLEIDVGGVHVAVELRSRPGVHVAGGGGD